MEFSIYNNEEDNGAISISVFLKMMDLVLKVYSDDDEETLKNVELVLENIKMFSSWADSGDIDKQLVILLHKYLKKELIRNTLFEQMLLMGYEDMESDNGLLHRSVSNYLGWHLHNTILKRESNDNADEISHIKYLIRNYLSYYRAVYIFKPKSAVFVGTVMVVNLTLLKSLIKTRNKKNKRRIV